MFCRMSLRVIFASGVIILCSILIVTHFVFLNEKKTQIFQLPSSFSANIPIKEQQQDIATLLTPKNQRGEYYVTVLVKSMATNFKRRDAIRKTWGTVVSINDRSISVIFMVGKAKRRAGQAKLKKESRTYGDILQVDMQDALDVQPRKLLSAFQWIITQKSFNSKFYILSNDNCVLNFATTLDFIHENEANIKNSIHCGYMFEKNAGVIRGKGLRSVPWDVYPGELYPPFCRGQMVIIAPPFIEKIVKVARITDIERFHLDDVLLFGILREKLNIPNSISNVINQGRPLVYDPWDETDRAVKKMYLKWELWSKELKGDVLYHNKTNG